MRPKLPDASYARDLQAGMAAKSADFGVDVLYKIPPRDVVPDAFEIIPEPGNPGVEIQVSQTGNATSYRHREPSTARQSGHGETAGAGVAMSPLSAVAYRSDRQVDRRSCGFAKPLPGRAG